MKALLTIARKDLKLLIRNRASFFWVLGFPVLVALLFGAVFSGSGGRPSLPVAVVDLDRTDYSRALVQRLRESEALRVRETPLDSAITAVRHGDLTAYIALRPGMSENFGFGGDSTSGIEIGIDPRQRPTADMLRGLVTQAVFMGMRQSFGTGGAGRELIARQLEKLQADTTASTDRRLRGERVLRSLESFMTVLDSVEAPEQAAADSAGPAAGIAAGSDSTSKAMGGPRIHMVEVTEQDNGPRTAYEVTFPSGLAWALIGTCMAFAISIVYERLTGTFLRLRLAPVSRAQVLAGKALACFIGCLISTGFLFAIGRFFFHIRVSDPLMLAAAVGAAAFCFTGLMMLIAAIGRSPQSVSGAGWAVMLVLSMTGGGMIPLFAMPPWLQALSNFSLVKWAILGVEGAVWRGFGWAEMARPLGILVVAGMIAFALGAAALRRSEG
ncbi:MAG TPA: ABC transporter permease [Candidatus Binatia bacterium]|nr:ABC transporter permease [Candidatus Binatia bacterium]